SSGDKEDLGEDASNQGRRINAINADEDITMLNVQDENVVEEVVDAAQVNIATITKLQSLMEVIPDKKEVVIDFVPLAIKSPSIVSWKIHKEGKKSYYQIMRADGKSQMYRIFSHMLKSFIREDLEDL
ncbi:hypothetical protein Tco_1522206, partial [Tanacetum coccineum]